MVVQCKYSKGNGQAKAGKEINMKQFEAGKTYYSITRTTGKIRLFKVTKVLARKSTGERVFVEGSYDGKAVEKYEIHKTNNCEWIDVDKRLCLVVTADEWKGGKN